MTKQQIAAMAAANYYDVLAVVVEMLRQYAVTLGLLAPGFIEQIAVRNGVDVTVTGTPIYRAMVKRRRNIFNSPKALGEAIQEALDATTYRWGLNRLFLLRVDQLPGGYVGLTLAIGGQ